MTYSRLFLPELPIPQQWEHKNIVTGFPSLQKHVPDAVNCLHCFHPFLSCAVAIMATASVGGPGPPRWPCSQDSWTLASFLGPGLLLVVSHTRALPYVRPSWLCRLRFLLIKSLPRSMSSTSSVFLPFFLSLWQQKYFNIYMDIIFLANVRSEPCVCRGGPSRGCLCWLGCWSCQDNQEAQRCPHGEQ